MIPKTPAYIVVMELFVQWVMKHPPETQERYKHAITVIESVPEPKTQSGIRASVNALLFLRMLAREGGYVLLTDFFGEQYDKQCRALLPYWRPSEEVC